MHVHIRYVSPMINPGQGVDHRSQGIQDRVKRKKRVSNASVYFDASVIIQPRVLGLLPLLPPYPLPSPLYIFSTHLNTPGIVYFTQSFVYRYIPVPRCLLSLARCLSHTISHIDIVQVIIILYRSGTDSSLHTLITSSTRQKSECHTIYIRLPLPPVHPTSTSTPIPSRPRPRLAIWTRCQWTLKMRVYSDTRLPSLLPHL